jgi:hypothetical protein
LEIHSRITFDSNLNPETAAVVLYTNSEAHNG